VKALFLSPLFAPLWLFVGLLLMTETCATVLLVKEEIEKRSLHDSTPSLILRLGRISAG